MSRNKHRSQLDAIDKIDMTPLIDLTFLLLIVFIITAPLIENAVDVSPPQMSTETPLPEDNAKVVTLNKRGDIVFENRAVSMDELLQSLSRLFAKNPKTSVLLRADGAQKYDRVIDVMKAIKNAGFKNISLVTEAEDK